MATTRAVRIKLPDLLVQQRGCGAAKLRLASQSRAVLFCEIILRSQARRTVGKMASAEACRDSRHQNAWVKHRGLSICLSTPRANALHRPLPPTAVRLESLQR